MMLWLLGGAAAIVGGASTARSGNLRGRLSGVAAANGYPSTISALRSWIPGGGSERATIGPSQLVLINDLTSPNSYVFHENVPPGGHISTNPDGSATIYNKDGQAVSQIAKPWAYDSLGRPQRTWYTVDNNGDLVQHIDPEANALYPILADPLSGGEDPTTGKSITATPLANGQEAVEGQPGGTQIVGTPDPGRAPFQPNTDTMLPGREITVDQGDGTSNVTRTDSEGNASTNNTSGPAPTLSESDNEAATDAALASIAGPYASQEQADSALYALQRQHLRSEGFRVTNAGVDPQTRTPLIEITNPDNGQQFVIPQTKDSAGGLPGTGVPNYNQVPTLSAPGQVTRIIPVRELPAGFTDADGTSPLTRTYAPDVVIDAANTPGAITAPQKLVTANKGQGTLGGGIKVPGVNIPIGPKAAPLNPGSANPAPGFEPGAANKNLNVNADRVAKIRVVGASPISATTFNYGGVNALSVNYQYQYQIQNVYTGGLNGAPYVVYESPWSQISPDQANALGLKLPVIDAATVSPSK